MTLAEIEDAIIARLEAKGLQARDIDVAKGDKGITKPAVYVKTEEGDFSKATTSALRLTLGIYCTIVFRHLKDEKERRRGIYPIIKGVAGILSMQSLGLKITPLTPKAFRNVTTDDLVEKGLIAYQMRFETSYIVERMDDEQAADLLRIGLDYYLKPGDAVSDASDLKTL